MTLDTQSLRPLFTEWARIMEANKSVLTELDSVVGDGDLGLTMSDGFAAAARYAQQSEERDLGAILLHGGQGDGLGGAVDHGDADGFRADAGG